MEGTSRTAPFPLPDVPPPTVPQVVLATTAFGGAVLVLDFNVPMMEETPAATLDGNNMYWNVGGVPYSCISVDYGRVIYAWNSSTQVAITSNSDAEVSTPGACSWIPDAMSAVRLRSAEGVWLEAFSDVPVE